MYEIDALSTGPLAPPFAHLLAPLIHSHALHCSLRLRAPLGSFDRSLPHSFHSLWERTLCLRIECVISYCFNAYCDGLLKISEQETEKEQVERSSNYRYVFAHTCTSSSYFYLKVAQIVILSWFRPLSQFWSKTALLHDFNSCVTDRRTDGRTDGWTDRRTDGHTLL